jgi:hypothetical protein
MALIVLLITACIARGQNQALVKEGIKQIVTSINDYNTNRYAEKVYLQTDKPTYIVNDTLWFKVYLFNSSFLTASAKSGLLYIELVTDSNEVVKRTMLPVYGGLASGNIELNGNAIAQGGYTLRAYTNWMRNSGEEQVFKKHIYIATSTSEEWLVNYNTLVTEEAGKTRVQLGLQVNEFNKLPVMVREMQLRITEGKKAWIKSAVQTDLAGQIKVDFDLPVKAGIENLGLSLQDTRKGQGNRLIQMPLVIKRAQNTDLQFMPEGGRLLASLPGHVAFKAIAEDGSGVNVAGIIYNSTQQQVAAFSSTHKGMGSFTFIPTAGETYQAKIKLADGTYKAYPLPLVATSGINMQVVNALDTDSCEVVINATPDVIMLNKNYYLVVMARGVACYGASLKIIKAPQRLRLSKQMFPSGMVHFVLAGIDKKALSERLVYIDREDDLKIDIQSNKSTYNQRDSVLLNLTVTDKQGAPVEGSFSIAVTDNGQVHADSLATGNMITHLLLTSNLKGTIEDAGYYAGATYSAAKWQHLDNLLLTQGWVGYNWDENLAPPKPMTFEAEEEFVIKGKVTNIFNKPIPNSGITLFSKKPFFLTEAMSNELGRFIIRNIIPSDTAVYFVQAKNKRGKRNNIGVEIDEFVPPVYNEKPDRYTPWFVNIDTASYTTLNKLSKLKAEQNRVTNGTVLKAVQVTAKKVIKGSKNLNGPGEADIVIDEEGIIKAGKITLEQLLMKYVPGFGVRASKQGSRYYSVYTMTAHFIIDGMDLFFSYPESMPLYDYYKQFLDTPIDFGDFKGVEVMVGGHGNQMKYTTTYLPPLEVFYNHAFIEITTRAGRGPFMKRTPGTYVYRPMPFNKPLQFYAPKYKINTPVNMTDVRSTIHWQPNIVTNKDGKATVSFYTADNPGSYTWILEGSDMQGSIGSKRGLLTIKPGQ